MPESPESSVRLAELVASLSLATDLGMGQPMEHALRTCLLALRCGEALGLGAAQLTEVYWLALLRRIGCTSDAHQLGRIFGDDLAAHARVFTHDLDRPAVVARDMLRNAGAGGTPRERVGAIATALAAGPGMPRVLFHGSCEVAQALATQLGFADEIRRALGQTFERWDGRGAPQGLRGEEIAVAARIVQVAEDAEVYHRLGGVDDAVALVRKRSSRRYDPAIAERFCHAAGELFAALESVSAWEAVLAAEPRPWRRLTHERLDDGLHAMALFADLKSPYTVGHSTGVAELAATAATAAGLPVDDVLTVRRAGLVHDLGRAGVPNGIWDRPGPLRAGDWERVRLHPYFTERSLARAPGLDRLAKLAGLHHERLDGSGYFRGMPAANSPPAARLLAAADAYHAMTEPRPHRPARPPGEIAAELRREVRAGRLDGEAVNAVLHAAGRRVRRGRIWPAGLTARGRGTARDRTRPLQPPDRRRAAHCRTDRRRTHPSHLRQAGRRHPPRRHALRHATRADRARPRRNIVR